MSAVVGINQNPGSITKIGLKSLEDFAEFENLYFGVPDDAYVINSYEGGEDLRNQLFVLYSRNVFGRGMGFFLDDNYNLELTLNYPSAPADIDVFFKFINDYCSNFGFDKFIFEGAECSFDDIDELKKESVLFNRKLIKNNLDGGLTIFGCIYPIELEEQFINQINDSDEENAAALFENYLDSKQKQDCYYAKPILYKNTESDKYYIKYVLTEGVPTIFPVVSRLPLGCNSLPEENIVSRSVAFIRYKDGDYKYDYEMPFEEFCLLLDIPEYTKFDATHIILTFDSKLDSEIKERKIEAAKTEMENWLSRPGVLGRRPYKLEYTNQFLEENGDVCYVFKFKKSMLGKWLIGIVSAAGTSSEMREYRPGSEMEDAHKIFKLLQK